MSITSDQIREDLIAATALTVAYDAAVAIAQERRERHRLKMEALRQLLTILEAEEGVPSAAQPLLSSGNGVVFPESPFVVSPHTQSVPKHPSPTKKSQMENAVDIQLMLNGTMHRKNILAALEKQGIMGTEQNPLAHLAAFLSEHRHKYASDGRGNFSAREQDVSEPPPAVPQDAGSAEAAGTGLQPAPAFNPEGDSRKEEFPWPSGPATE